MNSKQNRNDYITKYKKENLKRIPLEVSKEKYIEIKNHSEKTNESINGFIKRAIDQALESDIIENEE